MRNHGFVVIINCPVVMICITTKLKIYTSGVIVGAGIEPALAVYETAVLPLNYPTNKNNAHT